MDQVGADAPDISRAVGQFVQPTNHRHKGDLINPDFFARAGLRIEDLLLRVAHDQRGLFLVGQQPGARADHASGRSRDVWSAASRSVIFAKMIAVMATDLNFGHGDRRAFEHGGELRQSFGSSSKMFLTCAIQCVVQMDESVIFFLPG